VNISGRRQVAHRGLEGLVAHPMLYGPYIESPAQHSRGMGRTKCLQIKLLSGRVWRASLITRAHAEKFRATLNELAATPRPKNVHPKLLEAQKAGLKSQLQDLEAELQEYETLKPQDS